MKYLIALLLSFCMINSYAENGIIEQCWVKQVKNLNSSNCLSLAAKETASKFYHSFEPWQKLTYNSTGTIYYTQDRLLKVDTISRKDKQYVSKTKYTPTELLVMGYGSQKLSGVTKSDFEDYLFETCRYSPDFMLNHFLAKKDKIKTGSEGNNFTGSLNINNATVTIHINTADSLVTQITILTYDDLYGDLTSSYIYSQYEGLNGLNFPKKIEINKINGKIQDEVVIASAQFINTMPDLLPKPDDFEWDEEEEEKPEITIEKYNSNIYFLYLKQPDTKSLLVEFNDFLLVAEAPLSIANGKLIIESVKKLIPNKPIKYFTYGHFHNWYLGGLRPFVHEGCTILTRPESKEYVEFIANAKHSQHPDDLQKDPKNLQLEVINDSLTIKDDSFEMKMYVIGEKSDHTNDFMIYYFPAEKLVFQDDLVWIKNEGDLTKASTRQAGLYNAINDLGLNVETIIQAWPVMGYGVKNIIPFTELKQSINIK